MSIYEWYRLSRQLLGRQTQTFVAMLFNAELLVLIPVAHVREEFHWVTCPG
jgi:CRISPR/Cas system CMR subunit Cmr4 (Cas7 group RAMP superfamily)